MNPNKARAIRKLAVDAVCIAALIVGLALISEHAPREDRIRISRDHLKGSFSGWVRAGKPEGTALSEFMQDYPPETGHLFLSNRSFTIGGTNLTTMFAITRYGPTVFITTNGILIVLDKTGAPKIVP
jgi:hypothetical protein